MFHKASTAKSVPHDRRDLGNFLMAGPGMRGIRAALRF